jgi:DNA replication licensing factor MCM7
MADDSPQKPAPASFLEDPRKFYEEERERCRRFLSEYRPDALPDQPREPLKYMRAILEIKRRERKELRIELNDVRAFRGLSGDFVSNIEGNTLRYIALFSEAVDELLLSSTEADVITPDGDTSDILRQHREKQVQEHAKVQGKEEMTREAVAALFPPALTRKYELRIVPLVTERALALREVTSKHLGRLVQVRATVLRMTDVKPLLVVASYTWCVARARALQPHVTGRHAYGPLSAPSPSPRPQRPVRL